MIANIRLKLICNILIGLSLFLVSCITKFDSGYPRSVYFEPSEGSKEINGNVSFPGIAIYEGDSVKSVSYVRNDSVIVAYDWLTVVSKIKSNTIKINVTTNSNKTSRNLMLFGSYMDRYDEIYIYQNGLTQNVH